MSDITAAIRDHLEADAGVSAIVGTRIRRGWKRSSDVLPCITIVGISSVPEHHQTAAAGLTQSRVQIDSWALSRNGAGLLSDAVREALDGRPRGNMGDDNLDVRSVHLDEGPAEMDEPATDGSQQHIYRDRMDFLVWHAQSVPTFA